MSVCSFPDCERIAYDDGPVMAFCWLHKAINEADSEYTEAITAADELIPALIGLAKVGMCNQYLEDALGTLRQRAYDDAARYKLAWHLGLAELDMDKER